MRETHIQREMELARPFELPATPQLLERFRREARQRLGHPHLAPLPDDLSLDEARKLIAVLHGHGSWEELLRG